MRKLFLIEDIKLKCDNRTLLSDLKVTSQNFNKIGDKLQATEEDKKPNENILKMRSHNLEYCKWNGSYYRKI